VVGADAVDAAESPVRPVHVASVPNNPHLKYTAYEYSITPAVREQMKNAFTTSSWSIYNIVRAKHGNLRDNFLTLDQSQASPDEVSAAVPSGWVTFSQWADVMHHVTKLDLRWMSMIPVVVPDQYIRPSSSDANEHVINYGGFLDHYTAGAGADAEPAAKSLIETVYIHHKQLEIMFNYFDDEGSGQVTKEQFMTKCQLINESESLGSDTMVPISTAAAKVTVTEVLSDATAAELFKLLDLDDDGFVDVNEFFETYRVIDVKTAKPKAVKPAEAEVNVEAC
jgi:Ca2+-binding EF-hand superfamily protein